MIARSTSSKFGIATLRLYPSKYGMGGLSDGLYYDYALEICKRYVKVIIMKKDRKKLLKLLKSAKKYIEWANHTAEARHDNPESEYYDDGGQYEIMEETKKLLAEIDEALEKHEKN